METPCISCNESILQIANFCHKCGSQQKCKSCSATLIKDANNCISCGIPLTKSVEATSAINTVEYNETADSRSYKMAFSNEVGATVVGLVTTMLDNQPGRQQLKLSSNSNEGTEKIAQTVDAVYKDVTKVEKINSASSDVTDIPHIDDVNRTLECSEPHWILVYTFYHSTHGKHHFNRSEIMQFYKDQRGTKTRMGNFASNWDKIIEDKYIKTIRDGVLQLTDSGIDFAIKLINKEVPYRPKSGGKKASAKKIASKENKKEVSKKGTKTSAKQIKAEEFDAFKTTKKPSLDDFIKERNVSKSTGYTILAIAYYITKHCTTKFSDGNVEYAFKLLKLTPPLHLRQTITNLKTKNLWFDINDDSTWTLTRAGDTDFEKRFPSK